MTLTLGDPQDVEGLVVRVDVSGIGPNSGELTLVIDTGAKAVFQAFAGIMDSNYAPTGIEHGVFASFVAMATMAQINKRKVICTYQMFEKPRITALSLR